ncbi:ArnT family glycosyltransferase [Nitrospina watsonii]|uniref:Glycosyl transferase, family 39 n=1 Tax=Nitrospina watsonii TaxID=1323948 RepID=A0ABM9HA32_9BACT|nr:glycosyltransferase family 39 protein [Nitrospina watsonii]CAI2716989.1 Putative Glycosyl transferase, family 39 [Nitrospina watsonii]
MMSSVPNTRRVNNASRYAAGFVIAVLLLRALAAVVVPIMDDTEARYAEIARKMLADGHWTVPQFDDGVPFWGKPPLAFWLSAGGIALFGAGEFGPRAPILLIAAVLLFLFWRFVEECEDAPTAHLATVLLATSAVFLVSAGAVMTDLVLLLALFIMMSACWRFSRDGDVRHGLWMFAALGAGLLTKGLMILAVGGLPIAVWLTLTKKWKPFLARLPWVSGLALAAVIAVPWYVAAELKTPGFLHYFLIGEHFSRFFEPGWEGDRYGWARGQPFGMIWVFYLIGLAPWSVLVPAYLFIKRRGLDWMDSENDGTRRELVLFLLCWVLAPAVLLTFARNIIWTYSLPAVPPAAILLAMTLKGSRNAESSAPDPLPKVMTTAAVFLGAVFIAGGFALQNPKWVSQVTYKPFVEQFKSLCPDATCRLWCFGERIHSAEYYLRGQTKRIEQVSGLFGDEHRARHFFIGLHTVVNRLPPPEMAQLEPVRRYGKMGLWRLKPKPE